MDSCVLGVFWLWHWLHIFAGVSFSAYPSLSILDVVAGSRLALMSPWHLLQFPAVVAGATPWVISWKALFVSQV
jgi:hypothetical protein